jgi:hypothetical protein
LFGKVRKPLPHLEHRNPSALIKLNEIGVRRWDGDPDPDDPDGFDFRIPYRGELSDPSSLCRFT